jgi:hypothetical protein
MPQSDSPADHQGRQDEKKRRRDRLSEEHDAPPVRAVRHHTAHERERDGRDGIREAGKAQQQRRVGELEHQPALSHHLHVLG